MSSEINLERVLDRCWTISAASEKSEIAEIATAALLDLPGVEAATFWTADGETLGSEAAEMPPSVSASLRGDAPKPTSEEHIQWCSGLMLHIRAEGLREAPAVEIAISAIVRQVETSISGARMYAALEDMVAQEMTLAVQREASIRLILESMRDGLFLCRLDGTITEHRSRASDKWLGVPGEDIKLWDYLYPNHLQAEYCELAFECVVEDFLPFDVTSHQMPAMLERDGRAYALGYRQVFSSGTFDALLVTVSDVTERMDAERTEQRLRELPGIVGSLVKDRSGFSHFLTDTAELLRTARETTDDVILMRALHTLKGNTAIKGFSSFAHAVHDAEERALVERGALNSQDFDLLEQQWRDALVMVEVFLKEEDDQIRLTSTEYLSFLRTLVDSDSGALVDVVRSWRHPSLQAYVASLVGQSERIVRQLGKSARVVGTSSGHRLPEHKLRPWLNSLIHVLRNAVDHGIESSRDRRDGGKPEQGRLCIHAEVVDANLVLTIDDDGAGIAWQRVAKKAWAKGLPHKKPQELMRALFSDGLSTREVATEISGRGVGLSATLAATEDLGGTVDVHSRPGVGTSFVFRVPLRALEVDLPIPETPVPVLASCV